MSKEITTIEEKIEQLKKENKQFAVVTPSEHASWPVTIFEDVEKVTLNEFGHAWLEKKGGCGYLLKQGIWETIELSGPNSKGFPGFK